MFVVLLTVAFVFAAPGVDLPRTTLRARQSADLTMTALVLAALVLLGCLPAHPDDAAQLEIFDVRPSDTLTKTCVLIC